MELLAKAQTSDCLIETDDGVDYVPPEASVAPDSETGSKKYQCQTQYGFRHCLLHDLPVEKMDLADLFQSTKRWLQDKVIMDTFEELDPSQQRWCFYSWYAIDVLGLRGCSR